MCCHWRSGVLSPAVGVLSPAVRCVVIGGHVCGHRWSYVLSPAVRCVVTGCHVCE